MGYCIDMTFQNVSIPASSIADACKRIELLMDGPDSRRYAWVRTAHVMESLSGHARTALGNQAIMLVLALGEWGFDATVVTSPMHTGSSDPARVGQRDVLGVELTCWTGDKMGDEELVWHALAPCVKAGSVMRWHGEDGTQWQYLFRGDDMRVGTPSITWDTLESSAG